VNAPEPSPIAASEARVVIVTLGEQDYARLQVAAELVGCSPDQLAGALVASKLEGLVQKFAEAFGPKGGAADA